MGDFKISSEYFELVKIKPYREKVKILAVLKMLDKEGISPAILELWGNKSRTQLSIPIVSSKEEALKNGSESEEIYYRLGIPIREYRKGYRYRARVKGGRIKVYRVETCLRTLTYRVCRKGWDKKRNIFQGWLQVIIILRFYIWKRWLKKLEHM